MDSLKPALRVIAHSSIKGAQLGSGAGLLLVLPYAATKGAKPTAAGAACMAGAGMLASASLTGLLAVAKLARMEQAGIVDRADRLEKNEQQNRLDKRSLAGAAVGLIVGAVRIQKGAAKDNVPLAEAVLSKRGAWCAVAYAALGVGSVTLAMFAVKGAKMAAEKVRARMEKGDVPAIEAAAEAANDVSEEAVEAVREAAAAASAAATDAVNGAADAAADASGAN